MPVAYGISYQKRIYNMDPDIVPKCFWTVTTYAGRREYEDIVGCDNDIKSVFDAIMNMKVIKDPYDIKDIKKYANNNNISGLVGRTNTLFSKENNRRRFNVMFYCLVPMISRHFFRSKKECENYIEKHRYSFDVAPKPFSIEFEEEEYG